MKARRESEKITETEFNSLLLQSKNKDELTKDHLNKTSIDTIDEKHQQVPAIEEGPHNPKSV